MWPGDEPVRGRAAVGLALMAVASVAGMGRAAGTEPAGASTLLAAAFVVLGATVAMPVADGRYLRAGAVAAALATLVFLSWTYPTAPGT